MTTTRISDAALTYVNYAKRTEILPQNSSPQSAFPINLVNLHAYLSHQLKRTATGDLSFGALHRYIAQLYNTHVRMNLDWPAWDDPKFLQIRTDLNIKISQSSSPKPKPALKPRQSSDRFRTTDFIKDYRGAKHFVKFAIGQGWIKEHGEWRDLFPMSFGFLHGYLDHLASDRNTSVKSADSVRVYMYHISHVHRHLNLDFDEIFNNEVTKEKTKIAKQWIENTYGETRKRRKRIVKEEEEEEAISSDESEFISSSDLQYGRKQRKVAASIGVKRQTNNSFEAFLFNELEGEEPKQKSTQSQSPSKNLKRERHASSDETTVYSPSDTYDDKSRALELEQDLKLQQLKMENECARMKFVLSLTEAGRSPAEIEGILSLI